MKKYFKVEKVTKNPYGHGPERIVGHIGRETAEWLAKGMNETERDRGGPGVYRVRLDERASCPSRAARRAIRRSLRYAGRAARGLPAPR